MKIGTLEKISPVQLDHPHIMSLKRVPDVSFSKNLEGTLVKEITEAPKSTLVSRSLQVRDATERW